MAKKNMSSLAITFMVTVIIVGMGGLLLATVQDEIVDQDSINESDSSTFTHAYNASVEGLEGVETYGNWLPIIAIVIVASVVIGLLLASFARVK